LPMIVPSQVVAVIDRVYPAAQDYPLVPGGDLPLTEASRLASILSLIDAIPPELFAITPDDFGALFMARSAIEGVVAQSLARGGNPYFPWSSTVPVIRRVLALCPDEYPPAATADLAFIPDIDLRSSIRSDIGAADRAFSNAEWKAATVLAGSAIEALLLWAITSGPKADIQAASAAVVGARKRPPHADPNRWDLAEYATGAHGLGIVTEETFKATDLAREFRNLIHPGKAARLNQVCDRGTAHNALGALDHVVRDLS
jgi:hypothetical protein